MIILCKQEINDSNSVSSSIGYVSINKCERFWSLSIIHPGSEFDMKISFLISFLLFVLCHLISFYCILLYFFFFSVLFIFFYFISFYLGLVWFVLFYFISIYFVFKKNKLAVSVQDQSNDIYNEQTCVFLVRQYLS